MGTPLKVTLDKAGCATTWKEKVSKYSDFFYRGNGRVSTGQQSYKNVFRSLTCLGYCLDSNTEELDCVKTELFSRQVLGTLEQCYPLAFRV